MSCVPFRILLIEDNPTDARLVQEAVTQAGGRFDVARVQTMAEAIERLQSTAFDIALADLSLPDSCGLGTLERLVAKFPLLPIVVLTGLDDEATAAEAIRKGAQDYLVKADVSGSLIIHSIRSACERKRVEEMLREREQIYSAIVHQAADGIVLIDPETFRFVEFNDAACRGLGYTREEFAALRLADIQAGLTPEEVPERIQAILKAGEGTFENQHRCKDGKLRDCHISNRVVRIHDRDFLVGIWRDITERKRAEELLRESEVKLRTLFEILPAGVSILDEHRNVVECNRALEHVLGISQEGLLKGDYASRRYINGDGSPMLPKDFPSSRATKEGAVVSAVEVGVIKEDGTTVWTSVSSAPLPVRGLSAAVVTIDVTDRKRAEIALRDSEELYRSLVESIDYGITLIDSSYTIVTTNSSQAQLFNKTVDELRGRKCFGEFEARDAVCPHCPGQKAMASGQTVEVEAEGVRNDGSRFDARLRAFPLFASDGRATGFIELVQDITKFKQSQKALQDAKEAAECASRVKSEFLANMSHEIRTPMTAILGFSELLSMPDLPQSERDEFLEGIRRNGEALMALIGNILDLSKIEAEKLTLEKTACPVQQILDDVASTGRVLAERRGLAFAVECDFPLPDAIYTDALRLQQVLGNLIGNAVKFSERGEVRVRVTNLPEVDGRGRMQFAVSDTGVGIPSEKIAELFQPFVQVDGSSTRRFGGTGLGLVISKRLAIALGGGLEVSSKLGEGSTFTLTIDTGSVRRLLLTQPPGAAAVVNESSGASLSGSSPRNRLLLAEDDPDIQRIVSLLLKTANLEVAVADDGRMACDMAEMSKADGRPYDLILMDIQMPVMNGYEATSWLRQRGWKGPIVALTAHALAGDREKCLAAGCDDYVAKPAIEKGLRDILARHLARRAGS